VVDGGTGQPGQEDGKLLLSLAMVPGRLLYRRRPRVSFLAKEDERWAGAKLQKAWVQERVEATWSL
jgi:hypothetical protein